MIEATSTQTERHFTLVPMPHNAQNYNGSLPQFMPSMNGDTPQPKCHVYLWNPEKGGDGDWGGINDTGETLELFQKAVKRALEEGLEAGGTCYFTTPSGYKFRVLAD